jgi:hypothetical protein
MRYSPSRPAVAGYVDPIDLVPIRLSVASIDHGDG